MVSWRILNLVLIYEVLALFAFCAGCFVLWPEGAFGCFLGGGFGALNFYALKSLVLRGFTGDKPKLMYGLALAVKTVTALGVMTMILFTFKLNPMAFALGLSTMVVGFLLATAHVVLFSKKASA